MIFWPGAGPPRTPAAHAVIRTTARSSVSSSRFTRPTYSIFGVRQHRHPVVPSLRSKSSSRRFHSTSRSSPTSDGQPRHVAGVPRLLARHEQPARVRLQLGSREVRVILRRLGRGGPNALIPLPHLHPVAPAADREHTRNSPNSPKKNTATTGFPEPEPLPDPPPPENPPPPPPPPPNPELPPPACAHAPAAHTQATNHHAATHDTKRLTSHPCYGPHPPVGDARAHPDPRKLRATCSRKPQVRVRFGIL